MDGKKGLIELINPKAPNEPPRTFTFDSIYDWKYSVTDSILIIMHTFHKINVTYFSSRQRDLYDETFRDLVQSVLEGYNGTIFAYGQTGTGMLLFLFEFIFFI